MSTERIYKEFIDWFGRTWWKLPEFDDLMPMIKSNYTPEDAEFLIGMPFSGKTIEELADMKNMDPDELSTRMKELAKKGMVFESIRGDSARYRLNDSFFSLLRANLWHGKKDERARTSSPLINKYFLDGWFDQYADAHYKGLRTIPIDKTIEDTRQVLPFEDVIKVVEDRDYYTVSTCPCRHRHNLDPEMPDCRHPDRVCLHFDELGRYCVDNGLGREITKEETIDILSRAADSGLVHGISNWKERPDTICNCCSCCCMWFEAHHKLDHSKSMDASNFKVMINAETCRGCALCVKRCPMDALRLKVSSEARNKIGKQAVLDPDLCIGCGVCAHKCPTDSLVLERNEVITEPLENVREYMKHYMTDCQASRIKDREMG
jgi:formate hydrogenlyase subunit 6/NADH:ubiquinone oxidoreductase subunit I